METCLVHGLWHDRAQPAHYFGPDRNTQQCGGTVRPVALASGQYSRHDHRARVDRSALECVVKVFAMRRRPMDEGSAGSTESALMTYGCAWPFVVAAGKRAFYIILVARGDAKTHDVDQQILAFTTDCRGQMFAAQRGNGCSQLLGNGSFGQSRAHTITSVTNSADGARRRISGCWQAPRWQR